MAMSWMHRTALFGALVGTLAAGPLGGQRAPATLTADQVKNVQDALAKRAARDPNSRIISAAAALSTSLSERADRINTEISALRLTPPEVNSNAALWDMYMGALKTQVLGQPSPDDLPGLQVSTVPIAADWADASFGKFNAWRIACDRLPSWGMTFTPTTGYLTEGYRMFLDNIRIKQTSPGLQDQTDRAKTAYDGAVEALGTALKAVGPHWTAFSQAQASLPANRRLSFDQWYKQVDGRHIAPLEQKVRSTHQTYVSLVNRAGGGYAFAGDAIDRFENAASLQQALAPDSTQMSYHTCNVTPDLTQFIADGKRLADAHAPFDKAIVITHGTGSTHESQTAWGANASWLGILNFGSSGSSSTLDTTATNFRIEIDIQHYGAFDIDRPWFSRDVVRTFQCGPFIADGPVARDPQLLWGTDGQLALMPVRILVAYRPHVVMSLSSSDYSAAKSSINLGGGFSIGPFGFGGSYKKDQADIHFDDATNTISAQDNTDIPQVIGVVSEVFAKSQPACGATTAPGRP